MTDLATAPGLRVLVPSDPPGFSVPAKHNPRLQALADRINADEELRQLWRCANVNAVDRLGLGDYGEVHVRIVANGALKLLRLLRDAGQLGGIVTTHGLSPDDAEVVVVLAAALHNLGVAIHPLAAASGGLSLAAIKGRELLAGHYPLRERTIVLAEMLHCIAAQPDAQTCLTLEAGVLKLADALDITKGRIRVSTQPGPGAVAAVEEITIQRSKNPPVRVVIRLGQLAGLAGLEAMLQSRLRFSGLQDSVELVARVVVGDDARLLPVFAWPVAAAGEPVTPLK
jgi:metal-dependent HD superfamily phosphatase/phosphodiesterase